MLITFSTRRSTLGIVLVLTKTQNTLRNIEGWNFGVQIKEFIGLRVKCYFTLTVDGKKDNDAKCVPRGMDQRCAQRHQGSLWSLCSIYYKLCYSIDRHTLYTMQSQKLSVCWYMVHTGQRCCHCATRGRLNQDDTGLPSVWNVYIRVNLLVHYENHYLIINF